MERDEAARTGLRLLSPDRLGIARASREGKPDEEILAEALDRALAMAGLSPGAVAVAGHGPSGVVQRACSMLEDEGWRFESGHGLSRWIRKTKGERERDEARRVANATTQAMRRVAELLAAATEREGELWFREERLRAGTLRREVAALLAGHGLEQPEGNIVAAGADAGVPHTAGADERPLGVGETIIVDLFPKGWLFADCTRTFCVGEVTASVRRAHEATRAALRQAHEGAREGARAWDLNERTCELFSEHGYADPISEPGTTIGYVHGLGHGVGHELHEYPSFRRHAGREGVLAAGDLFTLEPGLYDPDRGHGVRLEDLVLLTEDGLENLTPLPYDLDPRAWE